jgi:hypothetical protein
METYRVHIEIGLTTVEIVDPPFKMRVIKGMKAAPGTGTALMEAVLYREEGIFVEHCRYLFEALGHDHRPVSRVSSVEDFRAAIGFFFRSVLDTEYYLAAVPKTSSLYGPQPLFSHRSRPPRPR